MSSTLERSISEAEALSATRTAEFWAGARATIPLLIGAMPFGLIFGALAVTSGLQPLAAQAMSAFVYAGSAQFIAVGLIANGANPLIIVLTTLVVNLRHLLYAASLAPHMKQLSQRWLAPLAFWMTDETYVVAISRYERAEPGLYPQWYYLGSAVCMYVNWQLWTLVGIWAGQRIADPTRWGLEFAFAVTFIGILVPILRDRPTIGCALAAAVGAIVFHNLPHQLGLILAAAIGVLVGVLLQQWQKNS